MVTIFYICVKKQFAKIAKKNCREKNASNVAVFGGEGEEFNNHPENCYSPPVGDKPRQNVNLRFHPPQFVTTWGEGGELLT
jgi:hypothetical protein